MPSALGVRSNRYKDEFQEHRECVVAGCVHDGARFGCMCVFVCFTAVREPDRPQHWSEHAGAGSFFCCSCASRDLLGWGAR